MKLVISFLGIIVTAIGGLILAALAWQEGYNNGKHDGRMKALAEFRCMSLHDHNVQTKE
jgi:hypothetical protein